jgi:drug/metabolite transporter (DMT)-like permease
MGKNNQQIAILLFILLAVTWGSSFILMKRGLVTFTPMQIGAIRIGYASLFTAIIGFKTFKYFRLKDLGALAVVGWLGNGLPYIFFPLAVSKVDSSIVGITNSLVPLFTLLVGLVWFKTKPTLLQYAGIFFGLLGAIYLIKPETGFNIDNNFGYLGFSIVATLFYGISINTIKAKLNHLNSLAITNLSLITVGPFMILFLFFTDFTDRFSNPYAWNSMGYLALLGIIGSSFAVIGFNYLIKISTPIFSSSVTYAVPIVAIAWGFLDGEVIGLKHFVGVGFILLGIYLVNLKRTKSS